MVCKVGAGGTVVDGGTDRDAGLTEVDVGLVEAELLDVGFVVVVVVVEVDNDVGMTDVTDGVVKCTALDGVDDSGDGWAVDKDDCAGADGVGADGGAGAVGWTVGDTAAKGDGNVGVLALADNCVD